MPAAPTMLLTAEDYRLLPETGPRYQLIEGELYMAPAPNRFHQDISLNIVLMLAKYLEKHPIGRIYEAPFDVVLGEHDVFQPDVIFVSKPNYKILTEAGAEGAPDLVVEILSPKTARLDKTLKLPIYARVGVKELWIVDPENKLVKIYFLQTTPEKPEVFYDGDTFVSAHFPELKIAVANIFKS